MLLSPRRALLALPVLLLARPARAVPDEAGFRALNLAAVDQVLLPAYRRFAQASANLTARLDALAARPADATALIQARQGFAEVMIAWQAIQHLRFGPAELFSRHPRIQFWPDPRNAIGRDLAQAIADRDASLLEVRANALGHVTTQGLPALERLLYGEAAVTALAAGDAGAAYRAALIRAIGGNLAAIGRDMLAGWSSADPPFARVLTTPSSPYAGPKEATLELFKALHAAVEVVADRKLTRALGASPQAARMQLLESWRSELSGANIQANLEAARSLYTTAFAPVLAAGGEAELAALLVRAFDQLSATAAALPLPIETAISDPARREPVQRLQQQAAALKALLAQRLPPALDIPLGFNALDGD